MIVVVLCIGTQAYAAAVSAFFSSGIVDSFGWPIRDFFGHPYALQLLGLVFGCATCNRPPVCHALSISCCMRVSRHTPWA